jgi:hypothetical protein
MSRSLKAPFITEQNKGKPQRGLAKRAASRAVRRAEEVASGAAHKRHFNSWNIRDWSFPSKDPKARRK